MTSPLGVARERELQHFFIFLYYIENNFIWSGLVLALLPLVLMKVEKNLIATIFLKFLNMTYAVMMASLCEFIYLVTVDSCHLFVKKVITCVFVLIHFYRGLPKLPTVYNLLYTGSWHNAIFGAWKNSAQK